MAFTNTQNEQAVGMPNEMMQSYSVNHLMEAELLHAPKKQGEESKKRIDLLRELKEQQARIQQLEAQFAESERVRSGLVEETSARTNSQPVFVLPARAALTDAIALTDIRSAFYENRSLLDELQVAHDDLASRYVDTLQEKDALSSARFRDSTALHAAHDVQERLRQEIKALRKTTNQAASQRLKVDQSISRLQRSLSDTEAQLDATTDDFAAHLASHQDKLSSAQRQLIDRDALIAVLQQANELAASSAQTATALSDIRIAELQTQLQDVHEKYEADSEEVAGQLQNALRRLAKKDRTLSTLHDKLQTAVFEKHERQLQYAGLEQEVEELSQLVAEHEKAVRAGVRRVAESEEEQWIVEDDRIQVSSFIESQLF